MKEIDRKLTNPVVSLSAFFVGVDYAGKYEPDLQKQAIEDLIHNFQRIQGVSAYIIKLFPDIDALMVGEVPWIVQSPQTTSGELRTYTVQELYDRMNQRRV